MLDKTDIAERGPTDPQAWFLFAQASRLMYADLGTSTIRTSCRCPSNGFSIRLTCDCARNSSARRPAPRPPPGNIINVPPRGRDATNESAGTSHFVVVDSSGDVVSMTTTVESVFGSNRTVGGFVLNNQLTDFSLVPTDEGGRAVANAVQGGKRPRSSMSPLIILDHDGHFVAALGSPGGSAILDYNAKAVVGLLAWRMSIKAAIELPNLIARGDEYAGEMDRFAPEVVTGLRERGIELRAGRAENSGFHAVVRHSDGTYEGAADSRREGIVKILPPDR